MRGISKVSLPREGKLGDLMKEYKAFLLGRSEYLNQLAHDYPAPMFLIVPGIESPFIQFDFLIEVSFKAYWNRAFLGLPLAVYIPGEFATDELKSIELGYEWDEISVGIEKYLMNIPETDFVFANPCSFIKFQPLEDFTLKRIAGFLKFRGQMQRVKGEFLTFSEEVIYKPFLLFDHKFKEYLKNHFKRSWEGKLLRKVRGVIRDDAYNLLVRLYTDNIDRLDFYSILYAWFEIFEAFLSLNFNVSPSIVYGLYTAILYLMIENRIELSLSEYLKLFTSEFSRKAMAFEGDIEESEI